MSSFTVDVVFVGGISGDNGQKAAAALIVLLVWRIARVVDGIYFILFNSSIHINNKNVKTYEHVVATFPVHSALIILIN